MDIKSLPPEILTKVFKMLEPGNLKQSALVCKQWKNITDYSALWSWCTLKLDSSNKLLKLEMKRAQYIETICLEECDILDLNAMLKSIENMPKLKIILGLDHKNLSYIESDLLARVVNKVEHIDWCFHTRMTSQQAQLILKEMAHKTKLKELQMVNKYLIDIQPEALGSAVNMVESLYMSDTNHGHILSPDQISGIFTAMSKETNLRNVMLRDIDISKVESAVMASAISKLDELLVWKSFRPSTQCDLSESQCKALFKALSKKTNLKRLVIETKHINQVDPKIFAEALNHLEEANIYNRITDTQARVFFNIMAEKTSIQRFSIFNNNLSSIQPNIIAKGINHLEELVMVGCSLTREQALLIFNSLNEQTTIKKLNLCHTDLSSINTELLTSIIKKLEHIKINNNHLSSEQMISILHPCAENGSNLKILILRNTSLTDIDPELLSTALRNMKKVELNNCSLKPEQVNVILEQNTDEASNLEDLTIINENLDQVEIGLLEEAASMFNVSYAV